MYKLARLGLFIMVISTLSGCGETTFDANNHVDSFIELGNNAPPETDTQLLFELWDVYLRGYVDHDGNVIEPDFAKLDGMNAEEILQELKNHVDYVQFEGFEMATIDDNGNYVNPAIYGSANSGTPSVDIEVRGNTVYLTAIEDAVDINDIVINRGNCRVKSSKLGKRISQDEYIRRKEADPSYFAIQIGQMSLASPGIYEYVKPFPVKMKFGQKFKWSTYRRCNIVEVTVADANGQWSWEFQ